MDSSNSYLASTVSSRSVKNFVEDFLQFSILRKKALTTATLLGRQDNESIFRFASLE